MDLKIGKPYSLRNYNCWDYCAEIRKEQGIKTQQYQPTNLENAFEIITAEMQRLGNGLTRVNSPQNFDIIIGHQKKGDRFVYHCGLYIDGNIVHCCRQARQVICETMREFTAKYEGFKLWR